MKRELHQVCATKRVWKTNEGRVLLTASGEMFRVDAFDCDKSELKALQVAIMEALGGWSNAPFTEFQDDIPQTEGKSDNAVPIEETG